MKIGLVDVDRKNYPNLALMKISAYHKAKGDIVEFANPMFQNYDRVYKSKIFTFTPDNMDVYNCDVIKGGTGYDLHTVLPDEIDRLQPDYSLYTKIDKRTAYGFITRGCPNKCKWCVVPIKEGAIKPYMDIDEISLGGRRDKIILMDNNILASDFGIEQLIKIADKGYHIDLNQGNSARLVTEEIADIFARIKWFGSKIRFAADTDRQGSEVYDAMYRIDRQREKRGMNPMYYLIYTMIDGDIKSCYDRIMRFHGNKRITVAAQPYRDFNNPKQVIPQWQKDLARWAGRKELWKSFDFKDFEPRKGFKCKTYFNN